MKIITLEKYIQKHYGKKGTSKRDRFDFEVDVVTFDELLKRELLKRIIIKK